MHALTYLCFVGAIALLLFGVLFAIELWRLSVGWAWLLKQLKRFDLAALFTLVSGLCIAFAIRGTFGLVFGLFVGLLTSWCIKLLLTEVLAGTKWGGDRSRLREFRQRHAATSAIRIAEQPRRQKPRCWWRIRLFAQPVSGPDAHRLPRLKSATGLVKYKRHGVL
jgi:hypothetical protein